MTLTACSEWQEALPAAPHKVRLKSAIPYPLARTFSDILRNEPLKTTTAATTGSRLFSSVSSEGPGVGFPQTFQAKRHWERGQKTFN